MRKLSLLFGFVLFISLIRAGGLSGQIPAAPSLSGGAEMPEAKGYAGSASCRECHETFYTLWSTSRHGLAMQPYSAAFGGKNLSPQAEEIKIGESSYRAELTGESGWIVEKGPQGQQRYRIEHALGGKNVYYFLTPLAKGRLQTLPLAYDVKEKAWFDTAASGVRHFPGSGRTPPVSWLDPAYTFNTSCYSCHVSQLRMGYDLKTDTYQTTWAEPGINCETCHGPSEEHNRVCREAPKGTVPKDLKIIRTKPFTAEQHNATCSVCHAKMSPVTPTFTPGERFFDHFDLVTLEDPDFYPDGRDLGENYTYTSWMMSPCVKGGELHCVKCHTSSGRYRYSEEKEANNACTPCHQERVGNPKAHTHHQEGSPGSKCISCHMPMTSFARMNRTDHSMLPPTPAATIAYNSPNACNLCHTDKDALWADRHVREWRPRDYQARVLKRAALIEAARKRDWSKLPEMLDYITGKDRDEVFATSLLRMIPASGDSRIVPVLIKAIRDPSPLVRSAAAGALQLVRTKETFQALVDAAGDDYRLVRVRAGASLIGFQNLLVEETARTKVEVALQEYLTSIVSRPDQWSSHFNLGNAYLGLRNPKLAIASYDTALKLEPQAVQAMVNESTAHAQLGETGKAAESLQKALKVSPGNAAANFNMGLLMAGQNDPQGAERHLKAALKADPQMAQAAYNLCVLVAKDRPGEAVSYCKMAADLRPQEPRYAYTLAFYQLQKGEGKDAVETLEALIERQPGYADSYLLLGETYEKLGKKEEAVNTYKKALDTDGVPDRTKRRIAAQVEAMKRNEANAVKQE